METLKSRRRVEALLALIPLAAMTLFTATAAAIVLRGGETARGWLGLAMMAACWLVMLAVFWTGFRARPSTADAPLREALARRLARNRSERRGYHVFWMMTPVFFLPLWMALQRHQEASFGVLALCAAAVIASLGWNSLRFFLALRPEQRRLEALLAEYE
ncbi:hypothetical protein [uncultured Caulobacter sp.]|uniref:hypothetical protein n=1 Tax=uncultured Caulobacter sp. TaxID=158749 RepID=UPI00260DA95F|nr:hypothetical protein [uncultured Caulobacter sp.]